MNLWAEIDEICALRQLTVRDMCDIFNVTEVEYQHMHTYHTRPSNYQLIMFICTTCHPIVCI